MDSPNLKDLVKEEAWKKEAGIIMPARFEKISVMDISMKVYITHQDIFGLRFTVEDLKECLSHLSVEDCLISISKILTILENDGHFPQNVQEELLVSFFPEEIKKPVMAKLRSNKRQLIFFEAQLLCLVKYAILYAKQEPANDFSDQKDTSYFTKAILGVTDLLVDEDSENWGEVELQEEAIRSLYFSASQNFINTLGRVDDIFVKLPQTFKNHHQYLDLDNLFKEATGFSIQDYLILGFSLIGLVAQQKAGSLHPDHWLVSPDKYFLKSLVTERERELILKEFSCDTKYLHQVFTDNPESFTYNYRGLKQHPFITFDGNRYIPMSLRFMKEKISSQIYWILFDHIKIKYGNTQLSRYTNFMGYIFEEYAFNLLKRVYPFSPVLPDRLVREPEYKVNGKVVKSVDNIIINASSLILLETKISQLKVYSTGILGDIKSFKEDVNKIVVEAFNQIQKTKESIVNGSLILPEAPSQIKKYYPVVVVYSQFPNFPLLLKIVDEEILKSNKSIDKDLLKNLQIIEIDELEEIEEFIKISGMSFEQLLEAKINDGVYKQISFKNFLHSKYKEVKRVQNKYLNDKWKEFTKRVTLRLFGKLA